MNVLVWHVHGSWMTAFVHGEHRYLVPRVPDRGPDGKGRALTWNWPASVVEIRPEELADAAIDVVVLQRPRDVELLERWVGRRPPMIYVEHDTPLALPCPVHPMADRDDVVVAHVTTFNELMWRTGSTRTTVIEHGVVDPGRRWTGHIERAVSVINEPERRSWVAGTDLLEHVHPLVPVDLFGMESEQLGGRALHQEQLHDAMAARRTYLHPFRWTSLGLTLIEAMQLGMPSVVLAATEVPRVIPRSCAVLAHDARELAIGVERFIRDPESAACVGAAARAYARERFGLERFLSDWDGLLVQVAGRRR